MKKGMKKVMTGVLTGAMVFSVSPSMVLADQTAGVAATQTTHAPTLDKYGFDWSYERTGVTPADNSVYNRVMYFDIYNIATVTKLQATFKVKLTDTTAQAAAVAPAALVADADENKKMPVVDEEEETPADPADDDEDAADPADPEGKDEDTPADPTDPAEPESEDEVTEVADENPVPTSLENDIATQTMTAEDGVYYVKVESADTAPSASQNVTDRWWFSIDKSMQGKQTVTWYTDKEMNNAVQDTDLPFKDEGTQANMKVEISDIKLLYQKNGDSQFLESQAIATGLNGLTKIFTSTDEAQETDYFATPTVASEKFAWEYEDSKQQKHNRVLEIVFDEQQKTPLDLDIKGLKATFDAKVGGEDYSVEVTQDTKDAPPIYQWWFSIDKGVSKEQSVKWYKKSETTQALADTELPFAEEKADDTRSVTISNLKVSYTKAVDDGGVSYGEKDCTEIALAQGATTTNIGERIFKDGKFDTPAAKTAKFEWNYTYDSDNSEHNRVMRFDFDNNLHKAVKGLKATFDAKVENTAYTVEVTQSITGGDVGNVGKWWFCIDKTDASNTDQKVVWKQNGTEVTSPFDAEGEQAGKTLNISNVKLFYQTTEDEAAINPIAIIQNNIPGTYTSTTATIAAPKVKTANFKWQYTHDDSSKHNRVLRFDFDGALNQAVTNLKATFTAVVDNKTQTVTVTQAVSGATDPIQKWWFSIDKSVHNEQQVTWSDATPFPNDELYDGKTIKISNLALFYSTDGVGVAATELTWNPIAITTNNAQNTFDKDGVVTTKPSGGSGSHGGGGSSSSKKDETKKDDATDTTNKEESTTVIDKDGNVILTETKADGSTVETITTENGTTAVTTTDADGNTTASAEISEEAIAQAQANNEALTIPVNVTAGSSSGNAPTIDISVPADGEEVTIEIPVKNVDESTVVVLVHEDGTEEIVKTTGMTENGVTITVSGDVQVKILNNEKDFDDLDGHWSEKDVKFLAARGIMSGVGEDTFGTDTLMTRGMVNTVLARLAGVDTSGGSTWYEKGTEWAMENGISDGTNPEGNVTRQQLATLLYRFAGSPEVEGSLDSYTDAGDVDSYAQKALIWATRNGIISGMGDGTLAPQDNATRSQVAAMLARYIRNFM